MRDSLLYISVNPAASIAARRVLKFPSDFSSSITEPMFRELRNVVLAGAEGLNASRVARDIAKQRVKKRIMFQFQVTVSSNAFVEGKFMYS